MKSPLIIQAVVFASIFISYPANSQTSHPKSQVVTDSVLFYNLVAQYTRSIDLADTVLAPAVVKMSNNPVQIISPESAESPISVLIKSVKSEYLSAGLNSIIIS